MVALAANPTSSACQLDGQQRQALAVAALGGESISEMSREHDVSRKFIYQQKDRATQALQDAFAPFGRTEKSSTRPSQTSPTYQTICSPSSKIGSPVDDRSSVMEAR